MKPQTKITYLNRRKSNVKQLEEGIKLLEKQIKDCIISIGFTVDTTKKTEIENNLNTYTNLLSGAMIIWCETLIKSLIYEYNAFEEEQINELLSSEKSLEQKWTLALNCAFYKSFSGISYNASTPIPNKNSIINLNTIAQSDKDKYEILYELIEKRIAPSIKVRNKIQHGDWMFSFNEAKFRKINGTRTLIRRPAFDRHSTKNVKEENLLTLKLKRNQFRLIYSLIKDLAVFKRYGQFRGNINSTPFQSNFSKKLNQIFSNQGLSEKSDFIKYRKDLVASKIRGKDWKRKNNTILAKLKRFFKKIKTEYNKG